MAWFENIFCYSCRFDGLQVCPGVAGGGVASGGGQGCFVAQRLPVGRTVSKCVHVRFPSQGRKGILASMLETPTFATLLAMQYDVSVSAKKRAAEASASSMSEETMVKQQYTTIICYYSAVVVLAEF